MAFSGRFLIALSIFALIIIAGALKIHGLTISQKGISVRRYYAFGFQKRELTIPEETLNSIEFWEHGSLDNTASTDSWLDVLFIPALFVSGKKGMTFKTSNLQSEIKSFKLYLDDKEYELIKELMQ